MASTELGKILNAIAKIDPWLCFELAASFVSAPPPWVHQVRAAGAGGRALLEQNGPPTRLSRCAWAALHYHHAPGGGKQILDRDPEATAADVWSTGGQYDAARCARQVLSEYDANAVLERARVTLANARDVTRAPGIPAVPA